MHNVVVQQQITTIKLMKEQREKKGKIMHERVKLL